jgi:hypothetical protein
MAGAAQSRRNTAGERGNALVRAGVLQHAAQSRGATKRMAP